MRWKPRVLFYAYKRFIFGEIYEDIVVRCNNIGEIALENYCVSREVVRWTGSSMVSMDKEI